MESLRKEFDELSRGVIPEKGAQWLIDNGFMTQTCSTKYHLCKQGGLLEHSINVTNELLKLTKELNLQWQRKESPIIVGLLHDLCKIDSYIQSPVTKRYEWNNDQPVVGHGNKSVEYVERYIMKLTDEEKACIENHMGAFQNDKEKWTQFTNAMKQYENVLWTHVADVYSTHVIEKEKKENE